VLGFSQSSSFALVVYGIRVRTKLKGWVQHEEGLFRIFVFLAAFTVFALSRAGACPVCYGPPIPARRRDDGGDLQPSRVTGAPGGVRRDVPRIRRRTRLILAQAAPGERAEHDTTGG